jgi:excisionase family DNA binding protein
LRPEKYEVPTAYDYREDARECVSIVEAARLLGIGRTRAYDLVNSGDLRSIKIGERRLVIRSSITAFVRRLEREQAADAT